MRWGTRSPSGPGGSGWRGCFGAAAPDGPGAPAARPPQPNRTPANRSPNAASCSTLATLPRGRGRLPGSGGQAGSSLRPARSRQRPGAAARHPADAVHFGAYQAGPTALTDLPRTGSYDRVTCCPRCFSAINASIAGGPSGSGPPAPRQYRWQPAGPRARTGLLRGSALLGPILELLTSLLGAAALSEAA